MSPLDFEAFAATPLVTQPFPYLVVPGFLRPSAMPGILRDFPKVERAGSFPTSELHYGPDFAGLLDTLEGPEMRAAFARKFELDLSNRPTMVTVRGQARAKDGRIHTDSVTKIITVLLYMNSQWEAPGGRLRLLRGPDNLDDVILEVPPDEGTLLAFKVTPHSWHGHEPFVGARRVIQLNWVTDDAVVRHEQQRHRLSARIKRLLPFG